MKSEVGSEAVFCHFFDNLRSFWDPFWDQNSIKNDVKFGWIFGGSLGGSPESSAGLTLDESRIRGCRERVG